MKKNVLFLIVVICVSFFSQKVMAQGSNYIDVVYLKNGSIIKGIIMENTPNVEIKISTSDGSLFVYAYKDILKFAKEEVLVKVNNYNYKSVNEKSPGLAFLFSFLLPGGGQYYNGEVLKGAVFTTVWAASSVGLILSADEYDDTLLLLSLGAMGLNSLISLIDAPVSASRINRQNNNIGLINLKIGTDNYLSLSPDVQLAKQPVQFGINKPQATLGLKLRLSL